MNEVIERCNWLVNKCEDKTITPDVKDDISYLLEEIIRLNKIIEIKNNRIQQLMKRTRSVRIDKTIEYLKNNAIFDTNDKGVNKILLSILLGVDTE